MLAAALKDNQTLKTLDLCCACRGAPSPHPRGTAARAHGVQQGARAAPRACERRTR